MMDNKKQLNELDYKEMARDAVETPSGYRTKTLISSVAECLRLVSVDAREEEADRSSADINKLEATLAYKEKNMVAIEEECAEQLEAGAKLAEEAGKAFHHDNCIGCDCGVQELRDTLAEYQKIVEDNREN